MKYNYFVSFSFGKGLGNNVVNVDREITNFDQIRQIEKVISEKEDLGEVVLTNYKLLGVEDA